MVIKHVLYLIGNSSLEIACFVFFSYCENDLEVVVYGGAVREKPSTKEEAREFLKGVLKKFQSTSSVSPFSMTIQPKTHRLQDILVDMLQLWDLFLLRISKLEVEKENGIVWRYFISSSHRETK